MLSGRWRRVFGKKCVGMNLLHPKVMLIKPGPGEPFPGIRPPLLACDYLLARRSQLPQPPQPLRRPEPVRPKTRARSHSGPVRIPSQLPRSQQQTATDQLSTPANPFARTVSGPVGYPSQLPPPQQQPATGQPSTPPNKKRKRFTEYSSPPTKADQQKKRRKLGA